MGTTNGSDTQLFDQQGRSKGTYVRDKSVDMEDIFADYGDHVGQDVDAAVKRGLSTGTD